MTRALHLIVLVVCALSVVSRVDARVRLIPHAPGGAAALNLFVCPAQNGDVVTAGCAGPFTRAFSGITNQLTEVDISASIASRIGVPGSNYLAVVAYSTPTTTTDRIVGMRFAYTRIPPPNVATLGANTWYKAAFLGIGDRNSALGALALGGGTFVPAPATMSRLGAVPGSISQWATTISTSPTKCLTSGTLCASAPPSIR